MKSIYILLTRSGTAISRVIALTTADPYTHASISFCRELKPLYSFSRKNPARPLPAGLREEPLTKGFFARYRYIPCALYELRVRDEVYETAKKTVEKMMCEQSKWQYSILGLPLCWLGIPFRRRYRYFCSQFVAEVLRQSEAIPLPKDPALMRPGDYTHLPGLSCRFEGDIDSLLRERQIA